MKNTIRHIFIILRVALGVALLYYVLKVNGGWVAAKQLISTKWLLPWLSALTIFASTIEARRLVVLFGAQGMRLSFVEGYRAVAIAALFNFCIPGGTGGDVMKLYYLAADSRGRRIEIATLVFVDRATALFCMLSLTVALAMLDGRLVWDYPLIGSLVAAAAVAALGLLVCGAVACSTRLRESRLYAYLMERAPLRHYLMRAADALYVFRKNKATLAKAAALSIVGHMALLCIMIAAGRVFMPNVQPLTVCLLSLLGMLANALPITPGGLGVGEAAYEGLFRLVGYEGGARLILAWRVGMLALCFLGSALYMTGARRVQADESPATTMS
jgi:glycosyltransferase 2 family protein